jgi:WD40 repeat protein
VPDGKLLLKFDNHSDWVFATAWTVGKAQVKQPGTPGELTNRVGVFEDDQHILSTGRDRAVKLILAKNGSFVDDINTFTSAYSCMVRRPNVDNVLVAGEDGIPRLYQPFRTKPRTMNQEDHNLIRAYEKQPGRVNALAFNGDGSRFVVGGEGGDVRIYNTDDGKLVASSKGMAATVYALAFRPDGQEIAVGGLDGQVYLFNADTAALVRSFVPVEISKIAARR